ncbi:MAG: bifunctional homocysteine S-methyltransferase/methylenetetrahydrofolate reductase [Acidobacteria bacterium]|nr:bifunctional homocysteine S-methyltransferase/methylenetetrahydrofolate reductase [Acidobacteriota bacterium]
MKPFLDALAERVLVCDGAMGTMLYGKGVFINRCFESLTLTEPDLVRDVHLQYLRAGADVIETNTFGANRMKLRAFGLGNRVAELNEAAATLAREARDGVNGAPRAYVAGAIGPLGVRIEPWGKTGVDEAESMFREQAAALAAGGVDLFVLETFRDLNEIRAAISAVRAVSSLPIVAQMTTEEDGNSLDGTPPEQFAPALVTAGATIVGLNCSVGPAPMLETIERLADVVACPLAAQPNAGRPRDIEGRNLYLSSPDYMASYARRFVTQGVRLVGGCCGTTPEHIRQIALAVKAMGPSLTAKAAGAGESGATTTPHADVAHQPNAVSATPMVEKSPLAARLVARQFVTIVELPPSRGYDVAGALAAAAMLRERGVDAVTIPDGARSGARLSALALAVLLRQQAGVETLLQYSCRDRNLLGIQSDLLGAHALGLRNLLGITGDVRSLGDIPDATAVFDVDSIGLTNVISRLNHGLDIGGQPIGAPTAFLAGVMANPSRDLDQELKRLAYKVEAGAEFIVTRPVFDVAAFERFRARVVPFGLPLIVGIWPFDSALHAEFMANEVPDVTVPEDVVDRMRRTETADAAAAEGVAIARELLAALRPMADGVHVFTLTGRVARSAEVLG